MKTDFEKMDNLLGGGLKKSQVTVIAGRPATFKSTLAFNIACNLSKNSHSTLIFSNDFNKELIEKQLDKIIGDDKEQNLIEINDSSFLTTNYIEKCFVDVLEKSSNKIDMIVIDRFNEVLCDNWNELLVQSKSDEIRRNIAFNELRRFARDNNVAIILCVHLGRELEERGDHKPILEDFSTVINFGGLPDNIIFMHRKWCYDQNEECEKVECIINAIRNFQTDVVKCKVDLKTFRLNEEI